MINIDSIFVIHQDIAKKYKILQVRLQVHIGPWTGYAGIGPASFSIFLF